MARPSIGCPPFAASWQGALIHHCPICEKHLGHPTAMTTCFGVHVSPCWRFHPFLTRMGREHECKPCRDADQRHEVRHKGIAQLVKQLGGRLPEPKEKQPKTPSSKIDLKHPDSASPAFLDPFGTDKTPNKLRKRDKKLIKRNFKAEARRDESDIVTAKELDGIWPVIHPGCERGAVISRRFSLAGIVHKDDIFSNSNDDQVKMPDLDAEVDRIWHQLHLPSMSSLGKDEKHMALNLRDSVKEDLTQYYHEEVDRLERQHDYRNWVSRKGLKRDLEQSGDRDWKTGTKLASDQGDFDGNVGSEISSDESDVSINDISSLFASGPSSPRFVHTPGRGWAIKGSRISESRAQGPHPPLTSHSHANKFRFDPAKFKNVSSTHDPSSSDKAAVYSPCGSLSSSRAPETCGTDPTDLGDEFADEQDGAESRVEEQGVEDGSSKEAEPHSKGRPSIGSKSNARVTRDAEETLVSFLKDRVERVDELWKAGKDFSSLVDDTLKELDAIDKSLLDSAKELSGAQERLKDAVKKSVEAMEEAKRALEMARNPRVEQPFDLGYSRFLREFSAICDKTVWDRFVLCASQQFPLFNFEEELCAVFVHSQLWNVFMRLSEGLYVLRPKDIGKGLDVIVKMLKQCLDRSEEGADIYEVADKIFPRLPTAKSRLEFNAILFKHSSYDYIGFRDAWNYGPKTPFLAWKESLISDLPIPQRPVAIQEPKTEPQPTILLPYGPYPVSQEYHLAKVILEEVLVYIVVPQTGQTAGPIPAAVAAGLIARGCIRFQLHDCDRPFKWKISKAYLITEVEYEEALVFMSKPRHFGPLPKRSVPCYKDLQRDGPITLKNIGVWVYRDVYDWLAGDRNKDPPKRLEHIKDAFFRMGSEAGTCPPTNCNKTFATGVHKLISGIYRLLFDKPDINSADFFMETLERAVSKTEPETTEARFVKDFLARPKSRRCSCTTSHSSCICGDPYKSECLVRCEMKDCPIGLWHPSCAKRAQPSASLPFPHLDAVANTWAPRELAPGSELPGAEALFDEDGKFYCHQCFEKLKAMAAKF